MNSFAELIRAARTCRRFEEDKRVEAATLRKMVDIVRITSSAANKQPLRYYTVSSPEACAKVFPHLKWAGALPQWPGPVEGERPTGYIVACSAHGDNLFVHFDIGIVGQTMQLLATDLGLGCCMFNNFSRDKVREALNIPEELEVSLVIALGAAKEVRKIVDAKVTDKLLYWRDDEQVHYVPKLTLDQVLLGEF